MAGRRRGSFWSAVAVAVVLILGGSAFAYIGYQRTSGADGAVKGYFAALTRGDAPDALGYGDLAAGPRTLLTSTVLREQQRIARMSNVSIVRVRKQGGAATVDVRYDLAFADTRLSVSDSVAVVKRGGSWRLSRVAALTKLDLLQARDRASIVGAVVPGEAMLVFPGAAPIRLDTPYLSVEHDTSVITLSGSDDTTIGVVASDVGRSAARHALAAALASCVTAGADPRCPLPSERALPGSVRATLSSTASDDVAVVVTSDPTGSLQLVGSVPVVGSYAVLDFNNVASTKRGPFKLQVNARTYPLSPISLRWQQAQP